MLAKGNRRENLGLKIWVMWPMAFAAASRGIALLPSRHVEKPPTPLVFDNTPWAPWVFSIAWLLSGLLLMYAAVWGHKYTVFSPRHAVAKLRLDDLGIFSIILMNLIWGISYYYSYIASWFAGDPNMDFVAARYFLPWAISVMGAWYVWFIYRTRQEVVHGEIEGEYPPDEAPD